MTFRTFTQQDIDDYEEGEPIWCPYCFKAGYKVRLGGKILEANEPRPADYDSWLQCSKSFEIIPIYELPKEEEIKDAVETIDNPFEQGKFILESIPNRSSALGKRASAKKRNKKYSPTNDKEINDLLRIYGENNVKIHYDSNLK